MKLPWKSMSDQELVACCRQRPIERAWERFGERYGCHLVAGVFVIWFGYINRPIPWYGPLALLCLYLFIALAACFFLFLTPACVRVLPFAWELDRRHSPLSFVREVREARRLFQAADPPDWVILVRSDANGPSRTRLTLFESPPRGLREHRSGPYFGVLREPDPDPLDLLVREERLLDEVECRSKLEALRSLDLDGVVDVETRSLVASYSWLAVLRRNPPATRKVRFNPAGVLWNPEFRQHPTYSLASLIIRLPEALQGS